jgi:hypothetical protein
MMYLQIGALMSTLIPSAYSFTSFVNCRIGSDLEEYPMAAHCGFSEKERSAYIYIYILVCT